MIQVTFSAIPVGGEFFIDGKPYRKTNNLGLSGMVCNAECLKPGRGRPKDVCVPFHQLVETKDNKLPQPTFRRGDRITCVKWTIHSTQGGDYVAVSNSYFHKGKELVRLHRPAWQLNPPEPVASFKKREVTDGEASSITGECDEVLGLAPEQRRLGPVEVGELVEPRGELDDAAEPGGWDAHSEADMASGESTLPSDYFPERSGSGDPEGTAPDQDRSEDGVTGVHDKVDGPQQPEVEGSG